VRNAQVLPRSPGRRPPALASRRGPPVRHRRGLPATEPRLPRTGGAFGHSPCREGSPASTSGRRRYARQLRSWASLLAEYEIDCPATPHVGAGATQMFKDSNLSAAGVFQRVGEHRTNTEVSSVVDGPAKGDNIGR